MVVISSFSDSAVDYGTNDAVFAVIVFGRCLTVVGPRMQMDCFGNMMLFSGGFFKKHLAPSRHLFNIVADREGIRPENIRL